MFGWNCDPWSTPITWRLNQTREYWKNVLMELWQVLITPITWRFKSVSTRPSWWGGYGHNLQEQQNRKIQKEGLLEVDGTWTIYSGPDQHFQHCHVDYSVAIGLILTLKRGRLKVISWGQPLLSDTVIWHPVRWTLATFNNCVSLICTGATQKPQSQEYSPKKNPTFLVFWWTGTYISFRKKRPNSDPNFSSETFRGILGKVWKNVPENVADPSQTNGQKSW